MESLQEIVRIAQQGRAKVLDHQVDYKKQAENQNGTRKMTPDQ
jgi:hypothetical protein